MAVKVFVSLWLCIFTLLGSQNSFAPIIGWDFSGLELEEELKIIRNVNFDRCYKKITGKNKCGIHFQNDLLEKYFSIYSDGKNIDFSKFKKYDCIIKSPCIQLKGNKIAADFPKYKDNKVVEATVKSVITSIDQIVFVFEVLSDKNECHSCGAYWHYLRVEKIQHWKWDSPSWREAFYSSDVSQYAGDYGRLGSFDLYFDEPLIDPAMELDSVIHFAGEPEPSNNILIYGDAYLGQGIIESYKIFYTEKEEKLHRIGVFTTDYSEEGTGKDKYSKYSKYSASLGFMKTKSKGLPDIKYVLTYAGNENSGTYKKTYKFNGEIYKSSGKEKVKKRNIQNNEVSPKYSASDFEKNYKELLEKYFRNKYGEDVFSNRRPPDDVTNTYYEVVSGIEFLNIKNKGSFNEN